MESRDLEVGSYYVCEFGGGWGRQICLFFGMKGDLALVRKWKANSLNWTRETKIHPAQILGTLETHGTDRLRRQIRLAKEDLKA